MKKEKFSSQKFLELATKDNFINLDLTLKEIISSDSASYFHAHAMDGDVAICPEFIFWKGPRPFPLDGILGNRALTSSLKESLDVANDLLNKIEVMNR